MSLGLAAPDENGIPPVAALFVQNPQTPGRGRKRSIRSPYLDRLPGRCWARTEVIENGQLIAHADATNYAGHWPVVAHPPCRAWGKLAHFKEVKACIREGERGLAAYALAMVRSRGGVMEHPEGSGAWDAFGLPKPLRGVIPSYNGITVSQGDDCGGFSLAIDQHRFGHRCEKPTWLYICGVSAGKVLGLIPPAATTKPQFVIAGRSMKNGGLPQVSHFEREHTPPAFAEFLIEIARRCQV